MSPPTGRKRVRRSAHSFAATPFGIICKGDACPCPLVGGLAVVPTARALRSHVAVHYCADSRQDFAAIRRELVADTHQEKARACSNPTALRATLTPLSRGWFCSWCFYTSKKTHVRRHVASAKCEPVFPDAGPLTIHRGEILVVADFGRRVPDAYVQRLLSAPPPSPPAPLSVTQPGLTYDESLKAVASVVDSFPQIHHPFLFHLARETGLSERLVEVVQLLDVAPRTGDHPCLPMVCEATNHYFDHVANMHVDQTNAVLKNALYKIGHDPDDSEYSFTRSHDPDVGRMAQKIICFLARKKCPRTLSLLALPPTADPASAGSAVCDILTHFASYTQSNVNDGGLGLTFCAALTFRLADSSLKVHSGNKIAKLSNYALKACRHGVLGHCFFRYADDFDTGFYSILDKVQKSSTTANLSASVRRGKTLQRLTPMSTYKEIDPLTETISVNGVSLLKSQWSLLIRNSNKLVDDGLSECFGSGLVDGFFDLSKDLTFNHHASSVDGCCLTAFGQRAIPAPFQAIMRGYLQISYAYFGGGAARGTEVRNKHSYARSVVASGRLHYKLISKKGGRHGVCGNQMVDHWLPPSVTRRVIMIEYLIQNEILNHDDSDVCMREFFRMICGFEKTVSIKDSRQFIASIYNTVCGSTQTVLSSDAAGAFHHSVETHNAFYSDTVKNGALLRAMQFWTAVGEPPSRTVTSSPRRVLLSATNLWDALRSLFGPGATWRSAQQKDAVHFAAGTLQAHGFVDLACGVGKSTIYLLPLMAEIRQGLTDRARTIVIVPHNGLLAQHVAGARETFKDNAKIRSLSASDLAAADQMQWEDFDLMFVSISSWKVLTDDYINQVESWKIKRIVIDEWHSLFAEFFRFQTSWASLRNIARFGAKIICLSATGPDNFKSDAANFMCLGNGYKTFGSAVDYAIPNVSIDVETVQRRNLVSRVVQDVSNYMSGSTQNGGVHIVSLTKSDATTIADILSTKGLVAQSLTSETAADTRLSIMTEWKQGDFRILSSTINCGIDSPVCNRVIVVGGSYGVSSFIQSMGRIRPHNQSRDAVVKVYYSPMTSDVALPLLDEDDTTLHKMKTVDVLSHGNSDAYRTLFTRGGFEDLMKLGGCIRRNAFLQIGVSSKDCHQCSGCNHDTNISRSRSEALRRHNADKSNTAVVKAAFETLQKRCLLCRHAECAGIFCLPYGMCFGCGRIHHRKDCIVSPKHFLPPNMCCGMCWAWYGNFHGNCNHGSKEYNDNCAYRSRLKGLIMYGIRDKYTDRDHNGSGALRALQELYSSRVTFEKDVAAIIRSLNGEPAKGYRFRDRQAGQKKLRQRQDAAVDEIVQMYNN